MIVHVPFRIFKSSTNTNGLSCFSFILPGFHTHKIVYVKVLVKPYLCPGSHKSIENLNYSFSEFSLVSFC